MALILKQHSSEQKGLLVFTHKEWGFFSGMKGVRTLKRTGRWPAWIPGRELRGRYYRHILKLKQRYYIGVHFGHYYPYLFNPSLIDFVVSGQGTVPDIGERIFRIPLNSRNFIPKNFTNQNNDKKWDILSIGMNIKVKNYDLLFISIKKTLSIRPKTTFLLIVPSYQGFQIGEDSNIAKRFYSLFNAKEQKQIAFLYLHPELEYGMNQHQLVSFYNLSRVFTLFSGKEGESRVISEALCCGLPAVVYSKLLGGGRDLLTEQNSIMFDDYDEAHGAWLKALENFSNGILDKPEQLTREDYSVQILHEYIEKFYKLKKQEFNGELINTDQLDQRLPAHLYDVPWRINPKSATADILSSKQLDIFLKYLEPNK